MFEIKEIMGFDKNNGLLNFFQMFPKSVLDIKQLLLNETLPQKCLGSSLNALVGQIR